MKPITKLLLLCTLVLGGLLFTTFDTTYANENSHALKNKQADTSSTKEGNKFIQYDMETGTETIITVEDNTNLGNQLFSSPGKAGSGKMEKIDFGSFRQKNTNFVDPFTREPLKQTISPRVIIGNDGRRQQDTSSMPYRAMTYIEFGNLTSTWSCSGGVIGRNLVVTNAHCVENSVLSATVVPGMNNNQWAYGHYRVTNILFPEEFRQTGDSIYDYAILKVATDSGGKHIGDRAGILSWREAGNIPQNTVLRTYGYPGDKMNETKKISLWGMTGFSDAHLENELVLYNMDTYFGQSGAPVLNAGSEMIAVHNAGYQINNRLVNGGPKIRRHFTNLFNQMNN